MGKMDDFDKILEKRVVPEMRDDLAARIIVTARPDLFACEAPRARRGMMAAAQDWLAGLAEAIAVPQPALVFSLVLFLGLYAGISENGFTASGNTEQEEIVAFLQMPDENGYEGEWL